MRIDVEEFKWTDAEGKTTANQNIYAHMTGASRRVLHKARHPVE